jgi:hypothetical protein
MRGFERTLKARARVGFDSSTIDSLLSFLRVSPDGLPPSAYHSIANDIIRLIVSDIKLAPETVTSLVAIVDDASCDALVRDYVVQHLEEVYRLAKFHLIVEKQLIRWMESGSESVPGAAMLIVERSWREGRYTGDASLIGQAISRQLSSDNLECRIAALSLGVALRDANVAVPARTIAADLHASPALRAAAIHALGVLGDPHSDPALLAAQLSRPGGSFLQLAVTSATASLTATR